MPIFLYAKYENEVKNNKKRTLGIYHGKKETIAGILLADWLESERNKLIDFLISSTGLRANLLQPFLSIGINLNLMIGPYQVGRESQVF
ncbi:hypothetical protein ACFODO_14290 [Acinetobacter sichuanensis]|uniref:Uncharacterized protein n=1 Tax=Acinetobacter sichuanensis TaxID=2136183 RepID=A0ABV7BFQ3_9GAMM|nr:hypothetical protein [Acinetobacter sichuanensis]